MAQPNSRETLIEYCLRRLGEPVIEINVDPDQLEDRIDEALQYYQEFHSDATYRTYLKHQITAEDISNEYITIPNTVLTVVNIFPISSSSLSNGMFSLKYQIHLNDIADMRNIGSGLAYYDQMQQFLTTLDMQLNGTPQVDFNRNQNRLYIFGDLSDDLLVGDYIVMQCYSIVDPTSFSRVFNDRWLKEYLTALIKQQWGANLIKFEGMQLPGGVTLNGRQIFDDGTSDIDRLREAIRLEAEMPTDFFVG
jgi:hypothetical protein